MLGFACHSTSSGFAKQQAWQSPWLPADGGVVVNEAGRWIMELSHASSKAWIHGPEVRMITLKVLVFYHLLSKSTERTGAWI